MQIKTVTHRCAQIWGQRSGQRPNGQNWADMFWLTENWTCSLFSHVLLFLHRSDFSWRVTRLSVKPHQPSSNTRVTLWKPTDTLQILNILKHRCNPDLHVFFPRWVAAISVPLQLSVLPVLPDSDLPWGLPAVNASCCAVQLYYVVTNLKINILTVCCSLSETRTSDGTTSAWTF